MNYKETNWCELYQNLDKSSLLSSLSPKDKGNCYILNCPSCQKRRAFIYKDGTTIICNRKNECNYQESIWKYLQDYENKTPQCAVQTLFKHAGMEKNNEYITKNLESIKEQQKELESKLTLSKAFTALKLQSINLLYSEKGNEAREYLNHRGFNKENIKKFEFGLFLDKETMLYQFQPNFRSMLEEPLTSYYKATSSVSIPIYLSLIHI